MILREILEQAQTGSPTQESFELWVELRNGNLNPSGRAYFGTTEWTTYDTWRISLSGIGFVHGLRGAIDPALIMEPQDRFKTYQRNFGIGQTVREVYHRTKQELEEKQ